MPIALPGVDAFGRNPEKMAPLGDGPYYAIELAPSIIYTIGGLTTDEYGRTLTWRNEPIPRLYSAGNIGNVVTYMAAYRRQRLLGPGRRGDQQHRRAGAVGL